MLQPTRMKYRKQHKGRNTDSNHRGHGQTIAKGIDINKMMAEILGKSTGQCKGRGGSMHLYNLEVNNMGCNGIVGGGHGLSTGDINSTFGLD